MDGFFLWVARAIAIAVWGVIGIFVWPFMVIRAVAAFVIVAVLSPFSNAVNFPRSVEALQVASGFYFNGFLRILSTTKPADAETDDGGGVLWAAIKFVSELYGSVLVFWLPLAMITEFPPLYTFLNFVLWPFTYVALMGLQLDLTLPWSWMP